VARITPDPVNPQGKIIVEDFFSPADIKDSAALQLCVQDTQRAEAWIQNNYWSLRWREADALYQSPPGITMWEGSTVPRANVNRFVVAETVNAILPQVTNGLFYEDPAFVLRPRPNQDENTTRAITALLATQLDILHIRDEVKWGLFSALNFGTAIWKWGFRSYKKKVRKYVRAGEPVNVPSPIPGQPATQIDTDDSVSYTREDKEEDVHEPTFENKDIRYILVEPGCHVPDIRKSKFVVDRMYLTYKDLIKLKDEEYYDGEKLVKRYMLPNEAMIRSWFEEPKEQPAVGMNNETTVVQGTTFVHHAQARFQKTTEDPMDEPLEVLERWDNDKVITVLNRVKLIRNEPNEFECIPFLSVNWWDIPDAFWGLGLGRVIGVEQRVQAGLINACLDLASLIVNPMFVRASGSNIQTQQIRQRIGGIVNVEIGGEGKPKSTKEALSLIEQPMIPESIIQQISMSQQRVEMTSGASQQLTMGASAQGNKGGQLGRSGTGAAGMIQATMNRIGGFAEDFVRQVYEPLLYQLHTLNKEKMPIGYIKKVLGEELGQDFKFDTDEFMSSPTEFEVLAGSHLAAKAQMAQSLFMMIQLFENAPLMQQLQQIDQKIVDIEELFHMVHDISGWKNYYKIIKPMTPQQAQAAQQANNPQAGKLQGQMQLNQQKFGQDQQIIDQENEARSVRDILRVIAEKSAEPEALLGAAAPTEGLGSNTSG
jgi:hypothetical protein